MAEREIVGACVLLLIKQTKDSKRVRKSVENLPDDSDTKSLRPT